MANTTPPAKPNAPAPIQQTSESKPEASVTKVPTLQFNFDVAKCEAHLQKVADNLIKYEGKPNHNPFFMLHRIVDPLVKRLFDGEHTEALQNEILSLDENHVPVVRSDDPIPEEKAITKVQLSPSGTRVITPGLIQGGPSIPLTSVKR